MYLILLFCAFHPQPSQAQDPLTGAMVIGETQNLIGSLQTLGASLGGDVSIAAGGVSGQLSGLLQQFQKALGTNVNVPLNSLGLDVNNLGRQLHSTVGQINQLVTLQRNCGVANVNMLVAGLKNAAQGTLANIPLIKAGQPHVDYFQFAGHNPDIVPASGGRLTISGYQLYTTSAPTVKLWDDSGHLISTPTADRATSDDAFAVSIGGDVITKYAGRTLLLDTTVHRPAHNVLGIHFGDDPIDLKLSLVIPSAFETKYKVVAQATYFCTQTQNVELPAVGFGFSNRACESGTNVTDTKTPQLPGGPTLHNVAIAGTRFASGPDTANVTHIGVSYTATQVTAAGFLDSASCISTPFSHTFLHDTHWNASVVPQVRYDQTVEHDEKPAAVVVDAQLPNTNINIAVPSQCFEPGTKTFSYQIIPIINGVDQNPLYVSPQQSGSEHGVSDQAPLGGMTINGQWNPNPVAGFSQVSVSIAAPSCGQ